MPLLLPRDNQRPFQNKTSGKTNLPNSHNCCQPQQTSWVALLEGTTKDHDLFLSTQVVLRPPLRLHTLPQFSNFFVFCPGHLFCAWPRACLSLHLTCFAGPTQPRPVFTWKCSGDVE